MNIDISELSTGKQLLLVEEMNKNDSKAPSVPNTERTDKEVVEHTLFSERKDFSEKHKFTASDAHTSMPIEGVGKLRQFIIIGNRDDYKVHVELDGRYIIDDTYTYLETVSAEWEGVAAYEWDGNYFVSVTDYPFKEKLNIFVEPAEETLFTMMRLDVRMKEEFK